MQNSNSVKNEKQEDKRDKVHRIKDKGMENVKKEKKEKVTNNTTECLCRPAPSKQKKKGIILINEQR